MTGLLNDITNPAADDFVGVAAGVAGAGAVVVGPLGGGAHLLMTQGTIAGMDASANTVKSTSGTATQGFASSGSGSRPPLSLASSIEWGETCSMLMGRDDTQANIADKAEC